MLQSVQPPVNTLDKRLWEETTVFEGPYHVELVLEVDDAGTLSRQVATFMVPSADFNFHTCNTPRTIFTHFPTFYKRVAAMQLPWQTNCKFSVLVLGAEKWQFSVTGPFNDFLAFSVTVLF